MLIIPLININIILDVHNHNFFCSPKYGHVSQRYVGSIVASEILKPVIKEGKSKDTFCHSSQIYIYICIIGKGSTHCKILSQFDVFLISFPDSTSLPDPCMPT